METKDNLPVLQQQAAPVIKQVETLVIKTKDDMEAAGKFRESLKQVEKAVKADKEKITKPLNEALKQVRAKYASIEDMVEAALLGLNKKMGAWQTVELARADAEAKKIADRTSAGRLKPETAVKKLGEIDKPADTLAAGTGFMAVQKFEVVGLNELSEERDADGSTYILPNEPKIRAAMRDGRQLAGVRYYTEQVPKSGR